MAGPQVGPSTEVGDLAKAAAEVEVGVEVEGLAKVAPESQVGHLVTAAPLAEAAI